MMASILRTFCLILAASGLSFPAAAEWKVAETAQMRVYSDGSEKDLVAHVRQLERFDWLLRMMSGAPAERTMPPLDIYLVRSASKLRTLADVSPDVAGFYRATQSGTAAFSVRGGSGDQALRILLHEHAHHFMMFHFPYAYPAWYVEGFAEYFQTAEVEDDSVTLGRHDPGRASWLVYADWIDARTLFSSDVSSVKGNARAMFYAQSWLTTHYLLRDADRSRQLDDYLRRIRDGESVEAAFEPAFGTDMRTFGKRLQKYPTSREITYTKMRIPPGTIKDPEIAVRTLPPAADDLLLPYALLESGSANDETLRDKLLGEIARAAARHPGDPYAERIVAGAEAQFGDAARGRALLAPLLKVHADDPDLNYLIGYSHLRGAHDADDPATDMAAARRHFARAYKTRPDHYQTLYNYVLAQPDPTKDSVLQVLELARRLAPQVSSINVTLAEVLISVNAFDRAEFVLRAMMTDPHSTPPPYVAELLERAKARRGGPAGAETATTEAAR